MKQSVFTRCVWVVSALLLILIPATLNAQQSSFLDSFYEIQFSPDPPRPNETVIAEVKTFSTNLNFATISWYVNGKLTKSGVGEKKISFRTGALGSALEVSAVIKAPDGTNVTKTVFLRPAGVEISWRANTYTPPFYKGKALFTNQSSATIFALPHFVGQNGKAIPSKNLVYKWKVGTKVMDQQSGFGKDSFRLEDESRFSALRITVEVSSVDGTMTARGLLNLEPLSPKLVLYPESPLYGTMTNHFLAGGYLAEGNDLMVAATPYFFSQPLSSVGYTWQIDGKNLSENENKQSLLMRKNKDVKKVTGLSVSAKNSLRPYDTSSTKVDISFGTLR